MKNLFQLVLFSVVLAVSLRAGDAYSVSSKLATEAYVGARGVIVDTFANRPATGSLFLPTDPGAVPQVYTSGVWKNRVGDFIYDEPPATASFTNTTNTTGTTFTKVANVLKITGAVSVAVEEVRLWGKPIATLAGSSVTATGSSHITAIATGWGVYYRRSTGGVIYSANITCGVAGGPQFYTVVWNSPTSPALYTQRFQIVATTVILPPIVRMRESGGTIFVEASFNKGVDFQLIDSRTTDFVWGAGNVPNDFGIVQYQSNTLATGTSVWQGLTFVGN